MTSRAGLRRCGAHFGVISVGPASQQLAPRSVELGAGPNWEWSNWLKAGPGDKRTPTTIHSVHQYKCDGVPNVHHRPRWHSGYVIG